MLPTEPNQPLHRSNSGIKFLDKAGRQIHFQENQNPAEGGQGIPNDTGVHLAGSSYPAHSPRLQRQRQRLSTSPGCRFRVAEPGAAQGWH